MSCETVATAFGVEAWCDVCGSVAWFAYQGDEPIDGSELEKAEHASLLHEDTEHAMIWLDESGWPTTHYTGHSAGGGVAVGREWIGTPPNVNLPAARVHRRLNPLVSVWSEGPTALPPVRVTSPQNPGDAA